MGRRRYTADFKRRVVVEAMRGDQTVQAIAAGSGANDEHDAFRRALWSPLMAHSHGLLYAKAFEDAHEAFPSNPPSQMAMDLHNNAIRL